MERQREIENKSYEGLPKEERKKGIEKVERERVI